MIISSLIRPFDVILIDTSVDQFVLVAVDFQADREIIA